MDGDFACRIGSRVNSIIYINNKILSRVRSLKIQRLFGVCKQLLLILDNISIVGTAGHFLLIDSNYNPSTSSIHRPKLFLFLVMLLCLKVLLLMLAKLSLLVLVMAKMVCLVYPLYVKARLNISGRSYCYKNRCGANGRPPARK